MCALLHIYVTSNQVDPLPLTPPDFLASHSDKQLLQLQINAGVFCTMRVPVVTFVSVCLSSFLTGVESSVLDGGDVWKVVFERNECRRWLLLLGLSDQTHSESIPEFDIVGCLWERA